jgi:hypothetical protein
VGRHCWRITGIYVSQCQEEARDFWARSGERAIPLISIRRRTALPLGLWFLLSAEPDIYLLSKTPKSPHRRLSLCSLPAPKQTDGGLGSCLRRLARDQRGLAACAPSNPDVLSLAGRFTLPPCLRVLRQARSPVFCVLLRACRRPSFWLLSCCARSVDCRRHWPVRDRQRNADISSGGGVGKKVPLLVSIQVASGGAVDANGKTEIEFVLNNAGKVNLIIPTSPHRGELEPSEPKTDYATKCLSLLISHARVPGILPGGAVLYGRPEVPDTLTTLAPAIQFAY